MLALAVAGCGGIPSAPDTEGDDIVGKVTGADGKPLAGVWVIAETDDLPDGFVRIVVTDEQGRYALPDMPQANFFYVWVRGYGLEDGERRRAAPGATLDLSAGPGRPADARRRPVGFERNLVVTLRDNGKARGEGATLRKLPAPQESVWVDRRGILGLGENARIVLRVPYAAGRLPREAEGRIDDTGAGWKGRGLWATTPRKAIQLQLRPDPLAR